MKPKRIMIESAMYELKQDLKLYGKPLLLTAMVLVAMQLIFHELCPMKILLGIPCPGCGLTHACLEILTLHWKRRGIGIRQDFCGYRLFFFYCGCAI